MSATNAFEDKILQLYLQNGGATNIGDATGLRGSTVAGVLYVSLHTANPNEGGAQNTTEALYGAYARQSVVRSAGGWTVSAGVGDNFGPITFPEASSGSESESYFGLGSAVSGAGSLDIWGTLTSPLAVSTGITPSFAAGALDVSLD